MEEVNKNQIDELFKTGLQEPEFQFVEGNWIAMKQKLAKDKKRRAFVWWSSASGIAAALLISMAWWGMQSPDITSKKIARQPVKEKTASRNIQKSTGDSSVPEAIVLKGSGSEMNNAASMGAATFAKKNLTKSKRTEPANLTASKTFERELSESSAGPAPVEGRKEVQALEPKAPSEKVAVAQIADLPEKNNSIVKSDTTRVSTTPKKFRPSFTLSLSAAPDISAVESFTKSQFGFNGGLLATVSLTPRLSLTTGAVLAKKIYQTGFENYKPYTTYAFPINPQTVNADCRVLDIPFNLNYRLMQKGASSVQLSLGASSYLMLTEKYDYSYAGGYTKGPRSYQVRDINKHYFGVGNIAVAYQRKLNNNAALSIQPYLKLPLTEIGYGNVKLLSTGVSFNLDVNISNITGKK